MIWRDCLSSTKSVPIVRRFPMGFRYGQSKLRRRLFDQADSNCFCLPVGTANDLMENCFCEGSGSSEATAVKSVYPRFHEANLRPFHCPGGQQDVVKYATVSFAKPDRDDMALRQYGATIDRPDGLAICAHPRSREAKRDRELIVDR
jgi:hypothetical protein